MDLDLIFENMEIAIVFCNKDDGMEFDRVLLDDHQAKQLFDFLAEGMTESTGTQDLLLS